MDDEGFDLLAAALGYFDYQRPDASPSSDHQPSGRPAHSFRLIGAGRWSPGWKSRLICFDWPGRCAQQKSTRERPLLAQCGHRTGS